MGIPTNVVHADQAMVSRHVGWTDQAIATVPRESGGHAEPTAPNGRRANVNTASQTPSVWAGVEPAKLYPSVRTSYLDAGADGVPQPAYLGQPIQLRPAVPTQLAGGQFYHRLVFDPGAGTAPVPNWNRPVELWVRALLGQRVGVPCNVSAQGWEVGFIPEAQGMRPSIRQPGVNQLNQPMLRQIVVYRQRQLLRWGEDLVKC